jgi:shikimate kinase
MSKPHASPSSPAAEPTANPSSPAIARPDAGALAQSPFAHRPLVLVGMMGAGKSTVGKRLATRLGCRFIDADRALEERLGVSVPTIFELEGEAGFREREAQLLADLLAPSALVLATGGGVVLREANRRLLAERAWVVYLRAQASDLWARTRRDSSRPLLQGADPRARILTLLTERAPLYEAVAHCIVETGRQPVERVVEQIVRHVAEHTTQGPPA